jgi:mono/diheme cytochrome c family protein
MKRMRALLRMAALMVIAGILVAVSAARAQDKEQKEAPAQNKAAAEKPGEQSHAQLPPPYKVVEGFYVDPVTMNGFRAWRAAACDRCHGAYQQGLVGPSLLVSLKTLGKEEFIKTVTEGRLDKGMPSFKTSKTVMANLDGLYAYLKGRAEGDITQYRVRDLKEK